MSDLFRFNHLWNRFSVSQTWRAGNVHFGCYFKSVDFPASRSASQTWDQARSEELLPTCHSDTIIAITILCVKGYCYN